MTKKTPKVDFKEGDVVDENDPQPQGDEESEEYNPFIERGLMTEDEFPEMKLSDMCYTEDCVVRDTTKNPKVPVCDYIVVAENSYDARLREWGFTTWHFDPLGGLIKIHHQASELVNQNAFMSKLVSKGFHIYGSISHVVEFIKGMLPKQTVEVISRSGWHTTLQKKSVYAYPNGMIIGDTDGNKIVFQPISSSPIFDAYHSSGELSDWQREVHVPLKNSPIPVFAQSASISGILLRKLCLPGFAADINGTSTVGKTMALQAGVSTYANAEDPATANGESCIQGLNTTDNAFEHLAAHSNDGVLGIDETGRSSIKDMDSFLYGFGEGREKARMNKDSSMRDRVDRCSVTLLSGERSIHDYAKRSNAGQRVRTLDISVPDEGAIRSEGEQTAKDIAPKVKVACGRSYGTAVPKIIQWLIDNENDNPQFFADLKQRFKDIHADLTVQEMTDQQRRGCQPFAVAILASEVACASGVFTESPEHYASLIKEVRDHWLENAEPLSNAKRSVIALKRYIIKHPNKFPNAYQLSGRPNGLMGFKNRVGNYLIASESLVEAGGGLTDAVSIARELNGQEFLKAPKLSEGSLQSRATVEGVGRGVYYIIHKSFLSDNERQGGE
jgi:putative DNA primase/helicase